MDDRHADVLPPTWPPDKKKQKTGNGHHALKLSTPKVEASASPEVDQAAARSLEPQQAALQEVNSSSVLDYSFSDVSASFDLASLECPLCKRPLEPPIYQCCYGHYACTSCIESNWRKCLKCNKPISKIRNLGLENIIHTLRIKCKFVDGGCKEILKHHERKDHEMHKGRSLEFLASHSINLSLGKHDLYTILKIGEKPLFLLHNKAEAIGNVVHLTSFCTPPRNSNIRWGFELNVFKGNSKLTLDSVAYSHEDLMVEAKPTDFVVVPSHFSDIQRTVEATSQLFELSEIVDVEICMKTDPNGFKLIKL
ncbi:hypothetical protein GOP47_0001765 [Adiantum capillus-veneris]|uniref:E3 ubiquitin-protein ligase n=1 Tax=Adiantum capillus-veneris TaxID=13818 RepID=A0A9D4V9F9_ADICA|nr:hypothetical protein GOP47_0001765 [Adiantum capillus-veneris]